MNIFYAFNDAYAVMAGISMFSILENCRGNVDFHIVDSGISDDNLKKIKNMVAQYGKNVYFYKMPDFGVLMEDNVDIRRWNINVFSKLFVGSILPDNVKKVISIDCDTVVDSSIEELWNTDMDDNTVAGVLECMSSLYRKNLGKKDTDYYFNSGLLMLNVDKLRKEKYEEKFWLCMKKYGKGLAYLDQDVINAVVPQNEMLLLHPRFNAITPIFCLDHSEIMKLRKAQDYYNAEEYLQAKQDPCIIHFTTFFLVNSRPWYGGSKHPKESVFLQYKSASPWSDKALWSAPSGLKERVKQVALKIMPKFMLNGIVSYLHGVYVPRKNLKNMKKAFQEWEMNSK